MKEIRMTAIVFLVILAPGLCIPLTQVSSQSLMGFRQDIPFQLQINQSALLQSKGITVQFLNVTEDSRCPSGVMCIWQGQVKTTIGIWQGGQDLGNFTLGLTPDKTMAIKKFDNYFIRLINVDPYPISTKKTLYSDYVITLQVSSLSPLKLFKAGIAADTITCNPGLQLILKSEDSSPACVKQSTANVLMTRGWAKS